MKKKNPPKTVDQTLSQDLPGWTRASEPSIEELREKFLGAPRSTKRTTVLVQPKTGGPAKVADVVPGKTAKIVQG